MTDLARTNGQAAIVERVVAEGDLSRLSPQERTDYYRAVCESVGLNPLTQPFAYIRLQGKLTLYARKDATDQLRSIHGVSITKIEKEIVDGVLVVTAHARDAEGREDVDVGAVDVSRLQGDALANGMMKAITKAKRRVTLSICGLGWLDETEVETIPGAQTLSVEAVTGEIVEAEECSDCLQEITGTEKGSAADVVRYTERTYGRPLCAACARKHQEGA